MEPLIHKESAHYNILRCTEGIDLLREIFPDAEADSLNFCLFSTSGVHGSYGTIEDASQDLYKEDEDIIDSVTFLVICPRLVCMKYGNAKVKSKEDIEFLRKLRDSSHKVVAQIGLP